MEKEQRDKIILDNLGLVNKVINDKIIYNSQNYDDIFMTGVEGLIKAVDNYDETRNVKFSTLAYKYIYVEILNNLKSKANKEKLISLDTTKFYNESNDQELYLISRIKDDRINIEQDYINKEEKQIINKLLRKVKLTDKKRFIVLLHYGFYNGRTYNRQQLAKIFNVSDRYIGRVIIEFLNRMNNLIKNEYGKNILDNKEKFKLHSKVKYKIIGDEKNE